MNRVQLALSVLPLCASTAVFAGQTAPGDFTAAAVMQDFEGFEGINSSPVVIGVDTFDGDDHLLRSSGKFGPIIGRSGTALSNNPGLSNSSVGFIDIELGYPALRAGLYVGFEFPWSAQVEFYNTASNLLGTIALSGDGNDNGFAGWQSDGGLIKRVRVIDTENDGSAIIIDDFIQEVPEPLSTLHFLVGFLMFLRFAPREKPKV